MSSTAKRDQQLERLRLVGERQAKEFRNKERAHVLQFHDLLLAGGQDTEENQRRASACAEVAFLGTDEDIIREVIEALLDCPVPPRPEHQGANFLERALTMMADASIPPLYAAGYRFDPEDPAGGRRLVAYALAAGRWPHPELIAPDILEGEEVRLIAEGLFRERNRYHETPALCEEHMDRLASLPGKEHLCAAISHELGHLEKRAMTLEEFRYSQPKQSTINILAHMMDIGLLDASVVRAQILGGINEVIMGRIISDAERLHLAGRTQAAPNTTHKGMRL